jgi:integrase
MKSGEEHQVPLSKPVLDLLDALPREAGNDYLFIGRRSGAGLSEAAMMKCIGRTDLTVHGFRSTFRDWAAEQTSVPHEVCEAALAHAVGDASTRAYRRTEQLPKRRQLMEQWAKYCASAPIASATSNVVGIRQ